MIWVQSSQDKACLSHEWVLIAFASLNQWIGTYGSSQHGWGLGLEKACCVAEVAAAFECNRSVSCWQALVESLFCPTTYAVMKVSNVSLQPTMLIQAKQQRLVPAPSITVL